MRSTESKQKQTFSPRRNLVQFQNPNSGNQTEKTQTKKKSRLEHSKLLFIINKCTFIPRQKNQKTNANQMTTTTTTTRACLQMINKHCKNKEQGKKSNNDNNKKKVKQRNGKRRRRERAENKNSQQVDSSPNYDSTRERKKVNSLQSIK